MALVNGIYQPPINMRNNVNNTENSQNRESALRATASRNPYQQYQNNTINTSTPEELTLMLYNGLVRFLKSAQQGIEEKSIEKANDNIIKAENIITEFMSTLDMQYAISQSLFSIYDYMNRRLIEGNIKKDKAIVEEVTGYAEELRDTWVQAMKLAKQKAVK